MLDGSLAAPTLSLPGLTVQSMGPRVEPVDDRQSGQIQPHLMSLPGLTGQSMGPRLQPEDETLTVTGP